VQPEVHACPPPPVPARPNPTPFPAADGRRGRRHPAPAGRPRVQFPGRATGVEEARRQVDRCLDAGVNLIDLYQVHEWDGQTPLEETLQALDDLVRWGKVRYAGCSNYAGWQLMTALACCWAARP
jgi:aryl-alcohol dehydrogenase-like predicted oxidoreductase